MYAGTDSSVRIGSQAVRVIDVRAEGGRVVYRSAQVATAVLREHAPYAEDAVTPSPIVIGDGDLAVGITRRIIEGWQRPGERRTVHCAGPDSAWAQRAGTGLEAHGRVEWHELSAGAATAPEVVRAMLDEWQAFKPGRYRQAPARVYVAYSDDTLTWPVANAIARELPGRTQVVAVVDEEPQSQVQAAGMVVVGPTELLRDPAHLRRTLADDLADEIVADLARWRDDSPSAFGPIVRPRWRQETSADRTPEGHMATLANQTEAVRNAIKAVAQDAVAVLGEAGFEAVEGFTARPEVQFPDPDELRVMADRLRALLPTPPASVPVREQHLRLIELANALPTLLRRVGRRVVRTDGRPDPMSVEAIWDLARGAHQSYTDVAKATRNATGSRFADATWDQLTEHERRSNVAQILDIPVKLATLGLSLAALPDAGVSGPDALGAKVREHAFTDGEVELLAEQEHRRWAHFEIRNGRQDHEWNAPWEAIKDTPVADYDRDAVRRIPQYLAYAGLSMVATPAEPRRFARRGRAWAWQLDEPFDWNSPRGHHLEAQAGDWWVIGEDGSSRTVDPASFASTYEQVEAQEYRRVGFVTAVEATERQMVPTREGNSIADPGDWIVTDARGTTWPVPRAVFEALYEPESTADVVGDGDEGDAAEQAT